MTRNLSGTNEVGLSGFGDKVRSKTVVEYCITRRKEGFHEN